MIDASDEHLHAPTEDPYWNESGWFSLTIPERDLCGWAYLHHRPNMRYTIGGFALWDPSGEDTYDCLYYNWGDPFPITEETEMFSFRLPNGFEVECVEPLEVFRLRNHAAACEADLTFTAFMPPTEPGFPVEWGPRHYEQGGRMRGRIKLHGEELEVDCFSARDRSWGPRTIAVDSHPRSGFPWAIADEKNAFLVFPVSRTAAEDDPAYGESDPLIAGWYLRDGVVGTIASGERRCTERGHDGRPLRSEIEAVDEHGRVLEAVGEWKNWFKWQGYSFTYEWWSLARWQFDGFTAWGEEEEFWPREPARRFLRSHTTAAVA